MKIMHIFPSFGLGGQQVRLAALVRGFGGAIEHEIVSLDDDLSAAALLQREIPMSVLPLHKGRRVDFGNLARLSEKLRASGAKLLCTYNFGSIEAAIANQFGPRLPHVHHEDGFGPDESPDRQKLRRILLRRFALRRAIIVAPSTTLAEVARKVWRTPAARLVQIANGVDLHRFQPPRGRDETSLVIGSVGAFRAEKNYARLIRAVAGANVEATLELVGDGPERQSLEAAAQAAGLRDRVIFPGRTTAPEQAYARFDIFALSSDTEQAPLSLVEAMASGLPVVATDVGDVMAMVSPLNRPFIVDRRDEKGLAASIAALCGAPDLRGAIGAANRKRAEEALDETEMIARYRDLYLAAVLRHNLP